MTENVFWLFEATIKPGSDEEFKAVMAAMITSTQQEPGTLNYEWFLNEDRTVCHIYERYADSDAALMHVTAFGASYAARFIACIEPTRFAVYGPVDDDLREILNEFGAEFMTPLDGFAR